MNEKIVWDTVGYNYNNEIFSVLESDKNGVVKKHILKHVNKNKLAIDFGCGVGKALPYLSPNFKNVIAIDISQKLLDQSEKRNYPNIIFKRLNLTKKLNLPQADFAFCCNVAICDDNKKNYDILNNVVNGLKKGGSAVIVIPSYESCSLSFMQLLKLYEKDKIKINKISKQEINPSHYNLNLIKNGMITIEGQPTKHYLLQEIYSLFNLEGFSIEAIEKVEYDWLTEFETPKKWMRAPYPWDWMVEIKRI